MNGRPQPAKAIVIVNNSRGAPSRLIEYAYYATFLYSAIAAAWGLLVDLLVPGMLAVLAASCVMRLGSRARVIYTPIVFPLSCAISYIAVQLAVHGEPLMGDAVRQYVPWLLMLVIIQSLFLRQGFLHRFVLVIFASLLATLPYMKFNAAGPGVSRASLEGTIGIGNANDLAAYFGFCAVYFAVFSLETKRPMLRAASGLIVVGCIYVVGLAVSRGALLAFAIATTVALRRLLKRGFVPLLLLLTVGWITYELGLFEHIMAAYSVRGTEESGRFLLWPLAIERFLNAPLAGVGGANAFTYVPAMGRAITAHNAFIGIALVSGVVPLGCFIAYWVRAIQGAWHSDAKRFSDTPFLAPLLVYTFLVEMASAGLFRSEWAVLTLSMALAAGASHQGHWLVLRRIRRHATDDFSEHLDEASPVLAGHQRAIPKYLLEKGDHIAS